MAELLAKILDDPRTLPAVIGLALFWWVLQRAAVWADLQIELAVSDPKRAEARIREAKEKASRVVFTVLGKMLEYLFFFVGLYGFGLIVTKTDIFLGVIAILAGGGAFTERVSSNKKVKAVGTIIMFVGVALFSVRELLGDGGVIGRPVPLIIIVGLAIIAVVRQDLLRKQPLLVVLVERFRGRHGSRENKSDKA